MKTYWELTGQQQTIDAEKFQEKRMEQKYKIDNMGSSKVKKKKRRGTVIHSCWNSFDRMVARMTDLWKKVKFHCNRVAFISSPSIKLLYSFWKERQHDGLQYNVQYSLSPKISDVLGLS